MGRGSETQLQMAENLNYLIYQDKGYQSLVIMVMLSCVCEKRLAEAVVISSSQQYPQTTCTVDGENQEINQSLISIYGGPFGGSI